MLAPPTQAPAPVTPTVSSVSITRRDPRMARHSSAVTVTYTAPEKPVSNSVEPVPAPVSAPVEVGPKPLLPMPPAPPPSVAVSKPAKTRCSVSSRFYEFTPPGIAGFYGVLTFVSNIYFVYCMLKLHETIYLKFYDEVAQWLFP